MGDAGKTLVGPIFIKGDLTVSGRLNKGSDTVNSNNGTALQVIQGVVQAVVTQPNVEPASGDVRLYGQNVTLNSQVVPGGTDGYFQIDEYINGAWQHLFEIMPSTTGNNNVLDLFISGRVFARDSLLSAPGRFFFKATSTPFGTNAAGGIAFGNGVFVAVGRDNNTGAGYISKYVDAYPLPMGSFSGLITNPFAAPDGPLSVAFGNGVFVATATHGKLGRSTDNGATWGSLIGNPFSATYGIYAIAFGNGVFIAGTAGSQLARSTDNGASWGSLITNSFTQGINSIAYGNGTFVAVGGSGQIARSTDNGATWGGLVSNPAGTNALRGVAFGNGVFIAVGDTGTVMFSIDSGATWVLVSGSNNPFSTKQIYAVAFGNGLFQAVTSDGYTARSIDLGLSWGVKYGDSSTLTVLATLGYSVCITSNGRVVIAGRDTVSSLPIAYSDYVEAGAGIVESGSNSNGSWIKFADGTMECWGLTGQIMTTTGWGGGLYYSAYVYFNLPATFIEDPLIVGNCVNDSGNYHLSVDFPEVHPSSFVVLMFSPYLGGSTCAVSWHAIGRWK
jgi:photosystem II stability/assembly factor-like uncharacterized protein